MSETEAAPEEAESSVGTPDFPELKPDSDAGENRAELDRFHDVQVTVSAELGRVELPIRELLNLNVGSVFELNRAISAPIELYAQGVRLGNGEVVVVDDSFAIRIKEIYPSPT